MRLINNQDFKYLLGSSSNLCSEIKQAFEFGEKFENELDKELDQVLNDFRDRKFKTQAETDQENAIQKEIEREQKILEKVSSHNDKNGDNGQHLDNRSSVSANEKVRQSMVSEIELDVKHTAIKKVLQKQDFETYKRIDRGEMDSELKDIIDSDSDIHKSPERNRNLLESDFDDLKSEDQSVYNVFWEDFEKREIRRREKDLEMLHDPMVLLDKLQGYSKNLYRNLNAEDKSELLSQIEKFLDEGVSPLQKYYDELKSQFNVPSKNLLNHEKKEFHKQVSMIRKAQKKEIDQLKFMTQIKSKEIIERLVETANQTVKKEMTNIIKQYDRMSQDLYTKEQEIIRKDKMMLDQEQIIKDLRLCLFQSTTRQALDKDKLMKMDKWLAQKSTSDQADINQTIKQFMKKEKPAEDLVDQECFMRNPFDFYSSYINISLRERESVIGQDLQTYYRSIIEEMKHRMAIKDMEIKATSEMNFYYVNQLGSMSDLCNNLKQEIEDLKKDMEYEKNRHEKTVNDITKEFTSQKVQKSKDNKEAFNLLLSELQVREQIQFALMATNNGLKDEVAALKQILMVPMLQHKYIEKRKFEEIMVESERIKKKEIDKIMNEGVQPKSTRNSYRSQPRAKKLSINPHHASKFSNFGFGESRKMSHLNNSTHQRSPSNSDIGRLPDILNKTTDSTTLSTLKSYRYENNSNVGEKVSLTNTSSKIIDIKRKLGNASQIQITSNSLFN